MNTYYAVIFTSQITDQNLKEYENISDKMAEFTKLKFYGKSTP